MSRSWLGSSVLTVVFACAAAEATLCVKCRELMFITNIGTCVACGGHTSSGAHKLCGKCSQTLGECEHCRAKLAPQKKVSPEEPGDGSRLAVYRDDANGSTVAVAVGDVIAIELAGNPTTGYQWQLQEVRGTAVDRRGKVEYRQSTAGKGVAGAGGVFCASFAAVRKGEATVVLAYRRPWEKDKEPLRQFSVTINVTE